MADLSFYEHFYGIRTEEAAFERFLATLQNYYDANFYVDWNKIYARLEEFRPELFLLSSLCGVADKEHAARALLSEYPKVTRVLPVLIACRGTVHIVEECGTARVMAYDFPKKTKVLSAAEVEHYVKFLTSSGVLTLLNHIKSIPDYVAGVEVGMDTNGRKNRGGSCGVKAVAPFVANTLLNMPNVRAKEEATFDYLAAQGCVLPDCFRGERWDWTFWRTDAPQHFVVMEVNHYGGGGSKLKPIARDYTARGRTLEQAGVGFVWVTDGRGWLKTKRPLQEAFERISHLVNIRLASEGQLEWALRRLLLQDKAGLKVVAA